MTHVDTTSQSSPLGATIYEDGVNFSVFSRNATGVYCLSVLSTTRTTGKPARIIQIDPWTGRTYYYWHVFVPGIRAGQLYGYRVRGPYEPGKGMRFDPAKVFSILMAGVSLFPGITVARSPAERAIMLLRQ